MEEPARRASLRVVFGIVALDLIGFGILIPQLGVYGVKFGASAFTAGLLVSVYSLMQLVFAPVLGRLSDRYGRRPVLLVSLAGSMAGYMLFAFAHSLPLLFLARVIDGMSGGNIATAQAYVADVTRPEERARGMGLIGAAFGLGFVLGPALGGFLGAWGGNLAIGLFAAGLAALNLALTFLFLPESFERGRSPAAPVRTVRGAFSSLRLPVVGRCLALILLFTTAFAQMEGTFSVFLLSRFLSSGPVPLEGGLFFLAASAEREALAQASLRTGWLFAMVGVLSAALQGGLLRKLLPDRHPLGGPAVPARREAWRVVVGFAVTALGLAVLPLAPTYGWLFPAMGLLAVGSAFTNPSLSAVVSLHAPAERLGAVLGTYQAFSSLGRILGPALGGWLFTRFGSAMPYGTAAGMLVAGAAVALGLGTRMRMAGAGAGQSS
ncbi:MFS transporter [Stigmatella aurantiaca]|uniref:Adventurous gliding motility protein P n=1 Tax=Stigmatella aurantiaca (strain DW4/3-1) TaxID=378806 RepID=Q093S7_STIAD|nr:tetracycline resistance MFS efflux pump [Stigmatella aurantiaca]ADO71055.1 Adventurous gliding motility protein P [Stigmatella aurantiaca DW4/3-1]EAU66996.1 adventurous gliding motility protein P [Stigmatella aurantiaca DW4/3-1]